jgi:hypothetical protein
MIYETLIPALRKAFPESELRTSVPPDPVATFPARHPEVGDVSIWDDDVEVTVSIGEITHGHFSPDDPALKPLEVAERVTQDVVAFLSKLFLDEVIVWKSPDGQSGGWRVLHEDGSDSVVVEAGAERELSLMDSKDVTYVWSGPIQNPEAGNAG